MKNVRIYAIVLLAILSLATVSRSQTEKKYLEYSLVGSISKATPQKLNPFFVLEKIEVQKLMLDIAEMPRNRQFIEDSLKNSEIKLVDLTNLGLVKQSGGQYVIGFSLFTRKDEAKIRRVSEFYARSLAETYLSRWNDIEAILKEYQAADVDRKALAYILLGCFSLDWDGLILTAEKKYRVESREQPGGNRYSLWAKEKSDLSLKEIYWGSTTDVTDNVASTTFGDHFSLPRNAFPDLSFQLYGSLEKVDVPNSLKPLLVRTGAYSIDRITSQVNRTMFALREAPKTSAELSEILKLDPKETENLLSLLVELEYVKKRGEEYSISIPVFTPKDAPLVQNLLKISRGIMAQWFAENYLKIKDSLKEITPLKYEIAFEDLFTEIWHYVFGFANRILVEKGVFTNPYSENRKYKGFVPVIWGAELAKLP
jgi:hypothetical protein